MNVVHINVHQMILKKRHKLCAGYLSTQNDNAWERIKEQVRLEDKKQAEREARIAAEFKKLDKEQD